MPSRNHPSRLIESLTLMNIGWDQHEGHFIFSLVWSLSGPSPTIQNRIPAPCRRRFLVCSFGHVITRPLIVDYETIEIKPQNALSGSQKFCLNEEEFVRWWKWYAEMFDHVNDYGRRTVPYVRKEVVCGAKECDSIDKSRRS